MNTSASDLSKWKRRVLEVEQELEAHTEREALLLKLLGRVSAMAEGVDPELDRHLDELQALIQAGRISPALERQARALEREVMRLFSRRDQGIKMSLQALSRLITQLQGLPVSAELGQRLSALKESLPVQLERYYEYPQIHRQMVELQGEALEVLDEPTWAPEVDDQLLRRLSRLLSDLLGQLSQVETESKRAEELRGQLHAQHDWEGVLQTLEASVRLSLELMGRHQEDFEEYLSQLNQQLTDIKVFLSETGEREAASTQAGKDLDSALRADVRSMQESVEEARDLDLLKSQVRGQLADILMAMDHYREEEAGREAQAQQRLAEMEQRLREMERQADTVQQRIEEQRKRALSDPLTELPNRAAYDERLVQEYSRWRRYQQPLTLVVCDLDYFKRINDTYGHQAGDRVLRLVAKQVAGRLRDTDFMARYGGEEFVILLPHTDTAQAQLVVEQLRQVVAECPFHFKGEPVNVTMSFGLATFLADEVPERVFMRADQALYTAKREGRNRCVLAPEQV